jgi:hypothetical protein
MTNDIQHFWHILNVTALTCPFNNFSRHFRQESIVNNRDYRVSQFTTADEFTDTTLRVITIEQNQFGNYTCRATNKLGQSSATVTLIGVCRLHVHS